MFTDYAPFKCLDTAAYGFFIFILLLEFYSRLDFNFLADFFLEEFENTDKEF